jgi:protein associated with RNAse G/E
MITVNSRGYDGTIRRSWKCELIERVDPLLVFVGEFDDDVEHPDLGRIEKGTKSYEYYWLDRWYNIFRFYTPAGELRNFYCNISMPPQFDGEVLDYIDLDIDIVVWPDHRYSVLDRDDYVANSAKFGYPAEVNAKVEQTLNELLELIMNRELAGVVNCLQHPP